MSDPENINLGWESLKGLSAKAVQAVLGFVGTILFARILGPMAFGGFYFLLSLIYIVNRPIWGIGSAAKKRFSEANARRGEIIGSLIIINFLLIVLVGIVLLGTNVLKAQTNVQSAPLVFLFVLGSIIFFFPFQLLLEATGKVSRATWIDTLRSIFTLPLQIWFVIAGFGAAGMGYGLASATLLVIPVTFYYIGEKPRLPSVHTLKSLWRYARYSILGRFIGKAYDQFDILLLGAFLTTGTVGYYEVALKLTLPAMFLTGTIRAGLMTKVSNLTSKGQNPASDVNNALSYTSILAIPIFFGALAFSERLIITAYGPEYREAASFLIGLSFYQVLSTRSSILNSTLAGADRPDIGLRISGITLLANIVIGVGLIYTIGAIGVVIATVIAELVQYILTAHAATKLFSEIELIPRPLLEQIVAGVVMFSSVWGLTKIFVLSSWVEVGITVGAGAIVYGVVLLAISTNLRFTLKSVYKDAVKS